MKHLYNYNNFINENLVVSWFKNNLILESANLIYNKGRYYIEDYDLESNKILYNGKAYDVIIDYYDNTGNSIYRKKYLDLEDAKKKF